MKKAGETVHAEPKGQRKLSGKRTVFRRNSGKQWGTEEAICIRQRIFQVCYRGTNSGSNTCILCLCFIFIKL